MKLRGQIVGGAEGFPVFGQNRDCSKLADQDLPVPGDSTKATIAFIVSLIIAAVTFFICFGGLEIGKKVGTRLAGKASILGGVILILIGLEIFVTGVF